MKKSNKLTAAVTASAVMAAMVVPAASAASVSFNDIDSSFAKDAIVKLADLGILNGKGEGKFDPTGNVTRAEFAKILTLALKLDVSSAPASATFADVATDAWSYKYVEAASKAKLINGVGNGQFGPNAMLTREDMAVLFVRALGANVTGKAANLTFADKDSISDYAKDAVAYAVELGLINGKGDNKFDAKGNASREAIAKVANLFLDVVAKGDLKVEGKTNVGVGEKVQFKATGANTVIWSVSGNGVIDQAGNFVANASGEATVTATAANGKTATLKVNVYAAAAAVKFGEVKDLVANNASQQEITVNVVDAKGNVVENFNGEIRSLTLENGNIAFLDANGAEMITAGAPTTAYGTLKVTNGVAKFKVQSYSTTSGVTTKITADQLFNYATNALVDGFEKVSTTVTAADQVATAVKATAADSVVAANDATPTNINIQVTDQDGKPMSIGTYGLKVNVSGAGTFGDGTTAEQALAYLGGGADIQVPVTSLKGKTGNINVTVTGEGLTTATATVKVAVAADPAKLTVGTTATTTDFVQGTTLAYTVGAVDDNGTPLKGWALGANKKVYVYDANGKVTSNVVVGTAITASIVADLDGGFVLDAASFTVEGDALKAAAGKYTVVVKDVTVNSVLKASDAASFTITPDVESQFAISSATDYVPVTKAENTYTVQLQDQFGNSVKKSGVDVVFTATKAGAGTADPTAAFNGKTVHTSTEGVTATVKTDADGKATANFVSEGYDGVVWNVSAVSAPTFAKVDAGAMNIVYAPTSQLKLTVAGKNESATKVTADNNFVFTLDQLDAYGKKLNGAEDDSVKVTVSNTGAIDWPAVAPLTSVVTDSVAGTITGKASEVLQYLNTLKAVKAGAVTFTVTDLSVPSAKSATATTRVWADTVVTGFALYDANSKLVTVGNELAVEANKEVALTLKPVDKKGNPIVATGDFTVTVSDAGATAGTFRLVSNGAAVPATGAATDISFTKGTTSKTVYYINSAAGSHTFTYTFK